MPVTIDNQKTVSGLDAARNAAPQATATQTEKRRVLAIDDNEEFRNVVKELLETSGFEVETVGNPVKALELYTRDKDKIHLVLLDYYMPQLDGAKTFEWLKRLNPDVKVIIVSGAEELRLRQILAKHSVDGYIRKPFRLQEALFIIRHVMSRPAVKAS